MIKHTLSICLIVLGTINLNAQEDNLVKNPSFEEANKKLKKQGQLDKAEGWMSPTPGKPDLFTGSKQGLPISVPKNVYGNEDAQDGQNYAGFVAYSYGSKSLRSYLAGELTGDLEKDAIYCVKYYVSLSDLSKYAVNNLSAFVTKKVPMRSEKEDIILEKDEDIKNLVTHPTNKTFNARYNWEPVCGVFTATGKEKHIVIGNFKDNRETKYEKLKKLKSEKGTQKPYAYYYVDNISIVKIDSEQECDCQVKNSDIEQRETYIYRKTFSTNADLTIEQKVENSTIYFDLLSYRIDPSMLGDLDKLVLTMQENPSLNLILKGHMDNEEIVKESMDEQYQDLDAKRIEVIIEYLTNKGISSERFTKQPMRASELADSDETELAKAKNRRVVFVIK